jgi:uncharacterized protein HemY
MKTQNFNGVPSCLVLLAACCAAMTVSAQTLTLRIVTSNIETDTGAAFYVACGIITIVSAQNLIRAALSSSRRTHHFRVNRRETI